MQWIDRQRLLKHCDGLIEFLHLLVAGALEVYGVGIAGIELDRLLKAGHRQLQFVG